MKSDKIGSGQWIEEKPIKPKTNLQTTVADAVKSSKGLKAIAELVATTEPFVFEAALLQTLIDILGELIESRRLLQRALEARRVCVSTCASWCAVRSVMLQKEGTSMKKLILAFCLCASPAVARPIDFVQYQPPDNDREQHDRDRSEWRQEQNRQDEEQRQDERRDHLRDDEPDVILSQYHLRQPRPMHCPAGRSWQNGCIAWGPKMQGQLFGPCIKSDWSCKRVGEQIQ